MGVFKKMVALDAVKSIFCFLRSFNYDAMIYGTLLFLAAQGTVQGSNLFLCWGFHGECIALRSILTDKDYVAGKITLGLSEIFSELLLNLSSFGQTELIMIC